jgi:hypothetical protein
LTHRSYANLDGYYKTPQDKKKKKFKEEKKKKGIKRKKGK